MEDKGTSSNVNPFLSPLTSKPGNVNDLAVNPFLLNQQKPIFSVSEVQIPEVLKSESSDLINPFGKAENTSSIVNPFLQSKNFAKQIENPFFLNEHQPEILPSEPAAFNKVPFILNTQTQQPPQAVLENPFSKSNTGDFKIKASAPTENSFKPKVSAKAVESFTNIKRDVKSRLGLITATKESVIKNQPPKPTLLATTTGKTIHLHDVPAKYFATEFLDFFYSRFGVLIKIDLKPFPGRQAYLTFIDHASAKQAIQNGRELETGQPLIEITWATSISGMPQKRCRKTSRQSLDDFKALLKDFVQNLSTTHCPTSMEKYQLLDTLDKKIREGIRRNPKEYKVLVGTCTDMCPEKERYFRDEKCHCSSFEISTEEGCQLDSLKAVKEYSRSSADKEVPLPHELRTISALNMTMNYLITNIVNVEYSSLSEWFDFLWNRTRAIRKDITQQNLKCLTSVNIVEKCARFHILCSHHLCEEAMHIFDSKINLENLTKCLQTLKHMYEDHWNDKQMNCPNEAEFRGYQILLNLNGGDTLREAMNFQNKIRQSEPVQFALQVFSTVQENNYSRFFKLIRKASFLDACLMHQYFTQMRSIGLKRMARAYTTGRSDIPFPLDQLSSAFYFNDTQCAAQFCNHYGFSTDDAYVYLNRVSYSEPEDRYPNEKSVVIDQVDERLMSEIVNGGPATPNDVYLPVNSFNKSGYYIGKYHELSGVPDELTIEEEEPIPQEQTDTEEGPVDPTFQIEEDENQEDFDDFEDEQTDVDDDSKDVDYVDSKDVDYVDSKTINKEDRTSKVMILREDIQKASIELVDELIEKVTKQVFHTMYTEWQENLEELNHFVEYIIALVSVEDMQDLAIQAIDDVKEEREKEAGELLGLNSKHVQKELIAETVHSLLKEICEGVYREKKAVQRAKVLQQESFALQESFVNSTITEMVKNVVYSVYKHTEQEKKADLAKIQHNYQRTKLETYFNLWIKAYKSHVYVKSTLQDFPTHSPLLSTEEAIKNLSIREIGEEPKHLQVCADVSWLDNERNFKLALQSYNTKYEKKRAKILQPISLSSIFHNGLKNYKRSLPRYQHKHNGLHWRLKIIAPKDLGTKLINSKLTPYILIKKFASADVDLEALFEKESNQLLQREFVKTQYGDMNVTVQYVCNRTPIQNMLMSASCILYIVKIPEKLSKNFWLEENRRLSNFLTSSTHLRNVSSYTKITPPFLLLLAIGNTIDYTSDTILQDIHLKDFQDRRLVDQVHCIVFDDVIADASELQANLEEALTCSVQSSDFRTEIISRPLSSFVENGLKELFFDFFHRYCLNCKKLQLSSPNLADVVCFYNNAIQEISNVLTLSTYNSNDDVGSNDVQDRSSFDEKLGRLNGLVLDLKLADFPELIDEDCFITSYESFLQYFEQINHKDDPTFLNRINTLFQHQNSSKTDPASFVFPWSEVLELFIINQLNKMYIEDDKELFYQTFVHYCEEIWDTVIVENPLKEHTKSFNSSLRTLNESGHMNQIKRRKYSREVRIRDSIESTNDELSNIEDSIRRRKSRKKSHDQYSPISDLVNQSVVLCQEINQEKLETSEKLMLNSTLNPNAKSFHPKKTLLTDTYVTQDIDTTLPTSLEDSVLDCLKSIDDTQAELRRRKQYWKSLLDS